MDKKVIEFKIDQLQDLIDDTSDLYTNEWELICLQKIKGFLKDEKVTGVHLKWLNTLWRDYKFRFNKGEDEGDSIHIRQWDTHMTGNSAERGLLWRRYKHYMPDTTDSDIDDFLDNGEKELNTGVFSNLKTMGLTFSDISPPPNG